MKMYAVNLKSGGEVICWMHTQSWRDARKYFTRIYEGHYAANNFKVTSLGDSSKSTPTWQTLSGDQPLSNFEK